MISATFTVFCDTEGCLNWEAQEPTRSRAWQRAKARGWLSRRVNGFRVFVCPDCIAAER